mgnify:FL=1
MSATDALHQARVLSLLTKTVEAMRAYLAALHDGDEARIERAALHAARACNALVFVIQEPRPPQEVQAEAS